MIGGVDIVFQTNAESVALDYCLKAALAFWPEAVFEDADADAGPKPYQALSFSHLREVFAYRDETAARQWEELGAVPETANSMIHLLISSSSLTVVVDDPDHPETAAILSAICEALGLAELPKSAVSDSRRAG